MEHAARSTQHEQPDHCRLEIVRDCCFYADMTATSTHGMMTPPLTARRTTHAAARLVLHLIIAPEGSVIRARPEMLLGTTALAHVKKWRAFPLYNSTASASGQALCSEHKTCEACRGGASLRRSANTPWRTGCAWCIHDGACVPDQTATCSWGAHDHVGGAGLARECPPPGYTSNRGNADEL